MGEIEARSARVDARSTAALARSPIAVPAPSGVADGWLVSARRSPADLRISDCTPLAKLVVLADEDGPLASELGVGTGQAARDTDGVLIVGSGPGEWLLLAPAGSVAAMTARLERSIHAGEHLVSVYDVTHGRALLRLTGDAAPALLAKVCAIDFHDRTTPNGAALRSSVGHVVTEIVRNDDAGTRSYLLSCEWSYGQYLFDVLLDAGAEFAVGVDGF